MNIDTHKITRLEVIDSSGRRVVKRCEPGQIQIQLQDDERTVKVFVDGLVATFNNYDE